MPRAFLASVLSFPWTFLQMQEQSLHVLTHLGNSFSDSCMCRRVFIWFFKSWVGPLEGTPTLKASIGEVKKVWLFAGHSPDPTHTCTYKRLHMCTRIGSREIWAPSLTHHAFLLGAFHAHLWPCTQTPTLNLNYSERIPINILAWIQN